MSEGKYGGGSGRRSEIRLIGDEILSRFTTYLRKASSWIKRGSFWREADLRGTGEAQGKVSGLIYGREDAIHGD